MKFKIGETSGANRRTVYLNDRAQNQTTFKYFLNDISTSKYTWWNFLPKSLILQFMRAANMYFLISTVIQCISIISPLEPFTAIFPLILVLAVSLSREAVEDYKRHRNDDLVNEQKTTIFNNVNFTSIMWKDVQIGDIIKISCEQVVPADIIVIATNEENGNGYVETANLDGERNLKCKSAQETVNQYGRQIPLTEFQGRVVCEPPNNNIHHFKGILYLDSDSTPIMLSNSNVMLRGTTLKNTDWVIGVVVYSGKDTKIMKNQGVVKQKTTHIEKLLNPIICITLLLQSSLCLTMSILGGVFQYQTNPTHWYLYPADASNVYSPAVQGLLNYFTYFLLLNTLIPISLIISLEAVKLFQSSWMEYDTQMHYKNPQDGSIQKMKVLNTLIHEELGKIEYIFTDKTGTLTSNNMIFRNANISGTEYSEKELSDLLSKNDYTTLTTNADYVDLFNFWLCASICHEVLLEDPKQTRGMKGDAKAKSDENVPCLYQGSSPDEVCLVEAAAKLNFKFLKRTSHQIFIKIGTEMVTFKLLHSIEFNSDRKRMSVIVQDMQSNKIFIYIKGADSFMLKNLSQQSEVFGVQIKKSLKNFSKHGLRTLCLGRKEIPAEVYKQWEDRLEKLQMQTIGGPNQDEIADLIQNMENEIESDIELLGATALEDKLQDGVPEVLQEFHEAGINVWMLTGDKLETAENIGYLCNLLSNNTKIFRVQSSHADISRGKFSRIKGRINEIKTIGEIDEIKVKSNSLKEELRDVVPDSALAVAGAGANANANAGAGAAIESATSYPSIARNPQIMNHKNLLEDRPHKNSNNNNQTPALIQKKSSNFNNKNRMFVIKKQTVDKHETCDFIQREFTQGGGETVLKTYTGFALVIEGEAIGHALSDEECRNEFLQIIQECQTVICCRSTPTQKAEVVNFVKRHFRKTCLAVGDGGNDVTMIQEADIGVGIIGKEGNQAALNSDYYFGQFRFLSRLLFVHGRWNLFRTSYFMNYFFLKNAIFTLQQYLFAYYCGKSGQSFWEDGYLLNFNSVITACAPIYYAAFEQDVNPHRCTHIAKHLPTLYKEFRSKDLFSYRTFVIHMAQGAVIAVSIFFTVLLITSDGIMTSEGKIDGLWYQSMMAYCATVGVVWGINFMDTRYFSLWTLFAYVPATLLLYFPTFAFMWDKFAGPLQHLLLTFIGTWNFWLAFLLIVGTVCITKYLIRVYYYIFKPELVHELELYRRNLTLTQKTRRESQLELLPQIDSHVQAFQDNAICTPAQTRDHIQHNGTSFNNPTGIDPLSTNKVLSNLANNNNNNNTLNQHPPTAITEYKRNNSKLQQQEARNNVCPKIIEETKELFGGDESKVKVHLKGPAVDFNSSRLVLTQKEMLENSSINNNFDHTPENIKNDFNENTLFDKPASDTGSIFKQGLITPRKAQGGTGAKDQLDDSSNGKHRYLLTASSAKQYTTPQQQQYEQNEQQSASTPYSSANLNTLDFPHSTFQNDSNSSISKANSTKKMLQNESFSNYEASSKKQQHFGGSHRSTVFSQQMQAYVPRPPRHQVNSAPQNSSSQSNNQPSTIREADSEDTDSIRDQKSKFNLRIDSPSVTPIPRTPPLPLPPTIEEEPIMQPYLGLRSPKFMYSNEKQKSPFGFLSSREHHADGNSSVASVHRTDTKKSCIVTNQDNNIAQGENAFPEIQSLPGVTNSLALRTSRANQVQKQSSSINSRKESVLGVSLGADSVNRAGRIPSASHREYSIVEDDADDFGIVYDQKQVKKQESEDVVIEDDYNFYSVQEKSSNRYQFKS